MSYEGMKKCQIVTLIIRVIDTESVSVTNDVRVIYWQDVQWHICTTPRNTPWQRSEAISIGHHTTLANGEVADLDSCL